MTKPLGTNISSPVRRWDSADTYPTFHAKEGRGGYFSCADTTERDAIYSDQREEGMVVLCRNSGSPVEYVLGAGLANIDWTVKSGGSGGGHTIKAVGETAVAQESVLEAIGLGVSPATGKTLLFTGKNTIVTGTDNLTLTTDCIVIFSGTGGNIITLPTLDPSAIRVVDVQVFCTVANPVFVKPGNSEDIVLPGSQIATTLINRRQYSQLHLQGIGGVWSIKYVTPQSWSLYADSAVPYSTTLSNYTGMEVLPRTRRSVKNIICVGDSNTLATTDSGVGAYYLNPTEYWPGVLQSKFETFNVFIDNHGRSSTGTNSLAGMYVSIKSHFIEEGDNTIVLLTGTNNSAGSEATATAQLLSFVDTAITDGFKVFVCTYPPADNPSLDARDWTNKNIFLRTFNGHIRDNAAAHGYTVIDLWDKFVGSDNDSFKNQAYISNDGVHLNAFGQEWIAAYVYESLLKNTDKISLPRFESYSVMDPYGKGDIISGSDNLEIRSSGAATTQTYGRAIIAGKYDNHDNVGVYGSSFTTVYYGGGTSSGTNAELYAGFYAWHPDCVIINYAAVLSKVFVKRGAKATVKHIWPQYSVQNNYSGGAYTTDGSIYPVGSRFIGIVCASTGTISADDYISFNTDPNWYRVKIGLTTTGIIELVDPLLVEVTTGSKNVVFPTDAEIIEEDLLYCPELKGTIKRCINSLGANTPSFHAGTFKFGNIEAAPNARIDSDGSVHAKSFYIDETPLSTIPDPAQVIDAAGFKTTGSAAGASLPLGFSIKESTTETFMCYCYQGNTLMYPLANSGSVKIYGKNSGGSYNATPLTLSYANIDILNLLITNQPSYLTSLAHTETSHSWVQREYVYTDATSASTSNVNLGNATGVISFPMVNGGVYKIKASLFFDCNSTSGISAVLAAISGSATTGTIYTVKQTDSATKAITHMDRRTGFSGKTGTAGTATTGVIEIEGTIVCGGDGSWKPQFSCTTGTTTCTVKQGSTIECIRIS